MAKSETVTVTFGEIELEVVGVHTRYVSATYLQPEEGGDFEIEFVYYKDVDVTDLICEIDSDFLNKIEEKILEK